MAAAILCPAVGAAAHGARKRERSMRRGHCCALQLPSVCRARDNGQFTLLPNAVEELLRFVSRVLSIARVLTQDFEGHATLMKKGDRIQLSLGAANHDPSQFPDPEKLRLDRANPQSVAFGYGPHYCIGAGLARVEAQIALGSLLQHVPEIQLRTEAVEYHPVFYLRPLKSLPIAAQRDL